MSKHRASHSPSVSDDDSISVTSTVPSEIRDEYVVDGVIAEREVEGEKQYLVRWEGYPDERCTWEPESSFQNPDTLMEWQAQKMRVSRGLVPPCNVQALLDRVENWITSTEERKSRRRAKRVRLGLPVSPVESDADEEDSCDDSEQSAMDDDVSHDSYPSSKEACKGPDVAVLPKSVKVIRRGSNAKGVGPPTPRVDIPQIWTEVEVNALMKGLERVKGPYFDRVLALYGLAGTVNKSLKDRSAAQLRKKACDLAEEYQRNGMEVPRCLYAPEGTSPTSLPSPVSGKAPVAFMCSPQNQDLGSIHSKAASPAPKTSPAEATFATTGKATQPDIIHNSRKENPGTSRSSPDRSAIGANRSGRTSEHVFPEPKPKSRLSFTSSDEPALGIMRKHRVGNQDSTVSKTLKYGGNPVRRGSFPGTSRDTGSILLPRTGVLGAKGNRTGAEHAQLGKSGKGPARLTVSSRQNPIKTSKKVNVSGAAVLRNWNKSLKPRKKPTIQHSPTNSSGKRSAKFAKLSTARRFVKAARDEPPPNIENLTFVNLKLGNMVKKSRVESPLPENVIKTPFELIQDGLEDASSNSESLESAAVPLRRPDVENTDSGVPTCLPQDLELDDTRPQEPQALLHVISASDSTPKPALKPIEDTRNFPSISSHSGKKQNTALLPNPDTGQRILRKSSLTWTSTPSTPKYPHNERPLHNLSGVSENLYQTRNEPSLSVSRPLPIASPHVPAQVNVQPYLVKYSALTQAQKDLAAGEDDHDVYGTIVVGQDYNVVGNVRFRGLDKFSKMLLINTKIPSQTLYIWCQHVCTAGDYHKYYGGVSGHF